MPSAFYAGRVEDLDVSACDAQVRIDAVNGSHVRSLQPHEADALADLLKAAAQAARAQIRSRDPR